MDLNPRDPVLADAGRNPPSSHPPTPPPPSSPRRNHPRCTRTCPGKGARRARRGSTVTTLGDGGFTSRAGSCLTGSLVEEGVVNLYRQLLGAEPAGFLGARGSGDATTGQDAAPSPRAWLRGAHGAMMGLGTICGFGAAGCGFGAAGAIGGAMSSKGSKKSCEVFPDAAVGLVTGLTTVFFAAASFASSCLYIAAARQVYFCAILAPLAPRSSRAARSRARPYGYRPKT